MSQGDLDYAVGQQVVATVEKLLAYGAFVRLRDGTRAYIRRRELTGGGNIDPRLQWQEGEQIEGEILKLADPDHCMELSHRALLPDPWRTFNDKFRFGDMVEGTVKNLISHGAFIEITPGVDGLVPLQELATWKIEKPEEVVWAGDTVEALITHLDCRTKKVRLSIRARLRQQEVVAGIMEDFSLFSQPGMMVDQPDYLKKNDGLSANEDTTIRKPESDTILTSPKDLGPLLVLDDYDAIRIPLVEWLQHQGYEVDQAKEANEAFEQTIAKPYGLLFVDLNLPGIDGVTFLRQVRQRGLDYRVVVMSTAEWLAERSSEIEELGVIEAFAKPLDLSEVECLLTKLRQGQLLPQWHKSSRNASMKMVPRSFQKLSAAVQANVSLGEQFGSGLKQLVAATRAEMGIIFRLDPVSGAVSITVRIGEIDLNEDAIHSLDSSPVRDVIEGGEQILVGRISEQTTERFRKLLDLLPFESCIGAPIEAGGETQRAVFLFHPKPNAFSRYHLRDTLAASLLFAVAIERQITEQRFRSLNRLLLSGQLMGGFSHEVYNKISGLEIQLQNLQTDCRLFEPKPDNGRTFSEIKRAVDGLVLTIDDLKDTVELFRRLMGAEADQQVGINQLLQKLIALLRPTIQKQKIKVETEFCSDMPGAFGDAVQLQQVFLNIMLNGIQHMILKPGQGKVLTIATTYQSTEEHPIKIRFSDTGPGIHGRLREKIFQSGFTTRLGGTGQGLFIARSLVEAFKGKIWVERSVVPIGTTFLVELPAT